MNKRLVWIAMVSFGIAVVCGLLAAFTSSWIGGDDRSWVVTLRTCAGSPWSSKTGSEPRMVDLDWRGSDAVKVNLPARIHYQPGDNAQASVSGDAALVSHVRMRDGTLEWDTIVNCFS